MWLCCKHNHNIRETGRSPGTPAIQRVQASLLTVCIWHIRCHSNETHVPIANPPDSAQLEGTSYHSPKSHLGVWSSVGMWHVRDTHIHADGHGQYTFRLAMPSRASGP